ncbi:MAG: hypothetical protein NC092_04555 [Butyrivibrio sp.]|nr:hypothetical protein [Muribaculum sp.]MCM1551945.1 hypothetical protein [Butyrivibrio sp.]
METKTEKKFGTFRTIEELNRAAAAQKKEGDFDALKGLALENGFAAEDAEEYFEGSFEPFCSPLMAAQAKLDQEAKELNLQSQLLDWKYYIGVFCAEKEDLCEAVFNPDKKLLDVLAAAMKLASANRVTVDRRIIKAAGLPDSAAQIGMVGKDELREIVTDYYLGGDSNVGV